MTSSPNNSKVPFLSLTKNDLLLMIISIFFPPVSVYLRKGLWTKDFLINFLLTLLLGLPGFIHAVWVIYTSSELRDGTHEILSTGSRLEEGLSGGQDSGPRESHDQSVPHSGVSEEEQPLVSQHFPLDNKIQT